MRGARLRSLLRTALDDATRRRDHGASRESGFSDSWTERVEGVPCECLVLFEAELTGDAGRVACLAMLLAPEKTGLLFGQGLARAGWRPDAEPLADRLFDDAFLAALSAAKASRDFGWRLESSALESATPRADGSAAKGL